MSAIIFLLNGDMRRDCAREDATAKESLFHIIAAAATAVASRALHRRRPCVRTYLTILAVGCSRGARCEESVRSARASELSAWRMNVSECAV